MCMWVSSVLIKAFLSKGGLPALKELYIDSPSDELTACCSTKGIEINPEYY